MVARYFRAALFGAAALSAAPATAFAQSVAYTNAPVVVYAGPGDDYPTVAELPAGVTVTVMAVSTAICGAMSPRPTCADGPMAEASFIHTRATLFRY
jgi:hypothetical protein